MEPSNSGTSSNTMFINRKELFNIMRSSGHRSIENQFNYLRDEMKKRTACNGKELKVLYKKLSLFKSNFKSLWEKAHRQKEIFFKNNKNWLETSISFPRSALETKRGRPEVLFENSSERSKRQKTKEIRESTPVPVLNYATQMALRASGQVQASKLLHEITNTSPERASKYIKALRKSNEAQAAGKQLMSGEEALSTMVEAKLTRHQYNVIRSKDPNRFPSYKKVQVAKKTCYPNKMDITITPSSAEVTLQALLNHTVDRLINVQKEVIARLTSEEMTNLKLISKWGFDGSSGHSSYKQMFIGVDADDSSVFISSIVPLRLISLNSDHEIIVWQNPRPSSTRYCRPIKINFKRESTELSISEKSRIDHEIENLQMSSIIFEDKNILVSHQLLFTMVDGKICNALTDTTSTQRCYICGASSKQFNSIDELLTRSYNPTSLQFGLSVLHCWIRMFECVLHVGYKLPIKKWQARKEDKEIVAARKIRIQNEFKNRMGLIVDQPKPGFGNSNDGNTARRFFSNPDLASEITGVDKILIKQMHSILVAISSGYDINIENFRNFALDTAKYFVKMYPWFYMPPTVHKILIHGPDVISASLLPIGQLSEEAQEARNKDFKKYRENYSRKCSREKCNEDVFNLMLITSDPLITSFRQLPKKLLKHFPEEVFNLIIAPNVTLSNITTDSDDDSSSASSDI